MGRGSNMAKASSSPAWTQCTLSSLKSLVIRLSVTFRKSCPFPQAYEVLSRNELHSLTCSQWNTPIGTSRHPETPANFNAGISNIQKVGAALDKPDWTTVAGPKSAGTIREVVSRLINDKYFNNYSKFASTRYVHSGKRSDPQPRDWLSLENLHNAIHVSPS